MDKNTMIQIRNISKIYKVYDNPIDRLKESVLPLKKKYHKEFVALNNISFDVKKGEIVGIVGKNGSGKSTLLKIITGVLNPTSGTVNIEGKISALLELGAGFNQELSGLENIYLNGTIMGFSKNEIEEKIPTILDFAEIGNFIYQPVKTYSSGMFARLAFAVAINVDPDILIVDEALSVGDMYFQEKSFTKMKNFREQGKTIFFVSHSLPSVRNFCNRAIWIHEGQIKMIDRADAVCNEYTDWINEQTEGLKEVKEVEERDEINPKSKIFIKKVSLDQSIYKTDEDIMITVLLGFKEKILKFGIGIIIYNASGEIITLFNTVRDDIKFLNMHEKIVLKIPNNDFLKGKYYITVSISDDLAMFPYDKKDYIAQFKIEHKTNQQGIPIADGLFRSKHKWIY